MWISVYSGCSSTQKNMMDTTEKSKQCQLNTTVSGIKICKPYSSCLYLPYHNDKTKTKELITFILHGQKNAEIINQDLNNMKIIIKSSTLPIKSFINVFYDDDNKAVYLCPKESNDWFNFAKKFTQKMHSNYLNVASTG